MKKLLFLSLAGILSAGCGSKADNALGELEGFKDRMCACADQACADGVKKDIKEFRKKMREEKVKKSDLSDDQKKRAKEIDLEMDTCAGKLRGAKKDKGGEEKKPEPTPTEAKPEEKK